FLQLLVSRNGGREGGTREIRETFLMAGAKNFSVGGKACKIARQHLAVPARVKVGKVPFRQIAKGRLPLRRRRFRRRCPHIHRHPPVRLHRVHMGPGTGGAKRARILAAPPRPGYGTHTSPDHVEARSKFSLSPPRGGRGSCGGGA